MPKFFRVFANCEKLTYDERWKLAVLVSKNSELDKITFDKSHDAIMGDGSIVTYYKGEGDECEKEAASLKKAGFDSCMAKWFINGDFTSFSLGLGKESDNGLIGGGNETMVKHVAAWIEKLKNEL